VCTLFTVCVADVAHQRAARVNEEHLRHRLKLQRAGASLAKIVGVNRVTHRSEQTVFKRSTCS
jgi:hypothetical protein